MRSPFQFDRRRTPWTVLGLALLALSAVPVFEHYLVNWPDDIWQVDLDVYREGARSLVEGRPVYDWLTEAPQYLPFTYPPFGAIVGLPLLLAPFSVIGWAWAILQVLLLWVTVGLAFRPLIERAGARRGLAQGAVAAVLVQVQPVQDGIRFGQVNAVLVLLCLGDLARREAHRWPRGSLVGLAAALKLTPGVFWIHWASTRQWRVLAASVGTAAAVTIGAALIAPAASAAFWTDALLDPERLGPNAGTANQSMRGVLLRIGPPEGPWLTLTWLILVALVGTLGFLLAARLYRLGETVAVVGAVGMLAVLLSPVSWVHHLHWGIVVLGALVADGRDRRRVLVALAGLALLLSRLPWTGGSLALRSTGLELAWARFIESSYCWFALLALLALYLLVARGRRAGELSAADADHATSEDDVRESAVALTGVSAPPRR